MRLEEKNTGKLCTLVVSHTLALNEKNHYWQQKNHDNKRRAV